MMSTYVDQPETFTVRGVHVDVDGLAAFRAMLHLELTQNLQPGAQRIIRDQRLGCGFGQGSASASVIYAQAVYNAALDTSAKNLELYVRTAQVLIDAIHDVIERYNQSDLTMGLLRDAINERMDAANATAVTPNPYVAAL